MMYLGESPFGRDELAVRAGCHVAVGQHAGKRVRRRLELEAQDVGKAAFFGFDDGVGVMGDQRHSMASACWASRRYRAPSSAWRPVAARPGA